MRPRIPQWPLLPMMMLGLAGCAEFEARKGPDPVINGAAVQTTSSNKAAIINALAEDAGYPPGAPVDYYRVAEAGFNYVDDQCRSYFDNLFFLQRRREELKSGLAASAATTGTILSITNAAVPTLGIVAAAFGLASNATDIVAGTYLFALPPAITQEFVEKRQLAFRAGAAANRGLINSRTSAYFQIQRYLDLCLPPTIEAEISKQISSTRAIPVSAGPGPFFSVESVGPAVSTLPRARFIGPSPITREEVRRTRIEKVVEEVRPVRHIEPPIARSAFVRQVQAALCVVPQDGLVGETTRLAIQDYLRGRNKPVPAQINPLDPGLQPRLEEAVEDVRDCQAGGFKNAYEVGGYGVPSGLTASKIKTLQKNMDEELGKRGSAVTVHQTGKFDTDTRKAILELRPLLVPGTTGDYLDGKLDAQLH